MGQEDLSATQSTHPELKTGQELPMILSCIHLGTVGRRGAAMGLRVRTRIVAATAVFLALFTVPVTPAAVAAGNPPPPGNPWSKVIEATGEQRWLTLLCRFADDPATPHQRGWYRNMMAKLDDYVRETSFGHSSVDGYAVRGWFNLPHPRTYYFTEDGNHVDDAKLVRDCTRPADSKTYFPAFDGITIWVNGSLKNLTTERPKDHAGVTRISRDGSTKRYKAIFISSDKPNPFGVLAHEMGHTFEWGHSGINERQVYSSNWDLMSGISRGCGFEAQYPEWCVPVHPIAFWKGLVGWISANQTYTVDYGENVTLDLHPHERRGETGGYLMARIPILGSTSQFLTVEARRRWGFDARPDGTEMGIPGEGVIVHRADSFGEQIYVLDDSPDDQDLIDDEATRSVGESFVEPRSGVRISVLSELNSGGYRVQIDSPELPSVPNDLIETATYVPAASPGYDQWTYAATLSASDPRFPCTMRRHGHTVWFRHEPLLEGRLSLSTQGSDHAAVVGIFLKEGNDLHAIACAGEHNVEVGSVLRDVPAYPGRDYYIEIAALNWWNGGNLHFNLSSVPEDLPEPVLYERAITLDVKHGRASGSLTASTNTSESACTSRVDVRLQRRSNSGWRTIKTIATAGDGSFRGRFADRGGKYRAIGPAFPVASGRCARAVSLARWHRH